MLSKRERAIFTEVFDYFQAGLVRGLRLTIDGQAVTAAEVADVHRAACAGLLAWNSPEGQDARSRELMAPMRESRRPVCGCCGSREIAAHATAVWNHTAQRWDTQDDTGEGTCDACGNSAAPIVWHTADRIIRRESK